MTKLFGFKAWALVASVGLTSALISGCNPEEPAKAPSAPPSAPPAAKAPAKPADAKGAAPAPVTPAKEETKKS